MTLLSDTVTVQNRDYQTLSSLLADTLTQGKTYSIQIKGTLNYKIGNAVFEFTNKEFNFTQGSLDVYVSMIISPARITVLENEED